VDDEAVITDSLARMFQANTRFALDVFTAYSAMDALELMRLPARAPVQMQSGGIDIIITDIEMPGLSGVDLLKQIRARWPRCQVIFLTCHEEFEYAYQAVQYHAARYVFKNEGDEVLLDAVAECIAAIEASTMTTPPPESAYQKTNDPAINRALAYIYEHLDGDLTLYAVSEKVALNPSYLSRRFKKITGKNLADTVADLRVAKAQRLLDETPYRINRVATLVGYELPAHFTKMFKRRTGLTPHEYRSRVKK
jgi:YesN/AraC family two-component response regulator